MEKYFIVLFKNKKRQRIIKKFITNEKAHSFYTNLIKKNENIIFDVKFENGKNVFYEIAILTNEISSITPIYLTDELGRNIRVKLDESNLSIIKIQKYKKEEKIFDLQTNKKITVDQFVDRYLETKELKMISVLNNKIIVQKDDEFELFSLKNESESDRFIESLSNEFLRIGRDDCLFIRDTSSPQRKYLLEILENKGFDKKILYRKSTTHPRLK